MLRPNETLRDIHDAEDMFQWAPTLGGECYCRRRRWRSRCTWICFNGHPPLGVNATVTTVEEAISSVEAFRFNGHPPLGVNATHSLPRVLPCGGK